MDVQTYFFRRTNMNALGQPRSWTDHLLWHHAAHTVDLFAYQAGSPIVKANAVQGPIHPTLGIAMDMSIQLKAENGAICTLSLSFNNDGPLGTFFRYICDNGTWIARYDDLVNGKDEKIDVSKVDVSMNGIELQDREFFAAIREGREPNSSVAQVLPCYQVLHELDQQLDAGLRRAFEPGRASRRRNRVPSRRRNCVSARNFVRGVVAASRTGHTSRDVPDVQAPVLHRPARRPFVATVAALALHRVRAARHLPARRGPAGVTAAVVRRDRFQRRQRRRYVRRGGGGGAAAAAAFAGIIGTVGAIAASQARRDYYYDGGPAYYGGGPGYYGGGPGYYWRTGLLSAARAMATVTAVLQRHTERHPTGIPYYGRALWSAV